jgi:hypothetical protein
MNEGYNVKNESNKRNRKLAYKAFQVILAAFGFPHSGDEATACHRLGNCYQNCNVVRRNGLSVVVTGMEQERVGMAITLPARASAIHVHIRQQQCLRFGVPQQMLDLQLRACAASVM